jgi:tetratricopeptide (TPR) repeat protein
LVVLLVFSKADNREPRYLFALLPYVAVVVGWGISQYRKSFIVIIAASIIIGNWGIGWLYGIERIGIATSVSDQIKPLDRLGKDANILNEIVRRTCNESSKHGYLNIIAIDPWLKSDWLAPVPADYEAIKLQLFSKNNGSCRFGYIGDNFFGASANDAWASIIMSRPRYIVIPDPDIYPPSATVINQTLSIHNFPQIFSMISDSGWFIKELPLNEDVGILVFKFQDLVEEGRRLSDEGRHASAIELLEKASKAEPLNNAEFWATLQLSYLRDGQHENAKKAGLITLTLSSNHYWALKHLVISNAALHEWHDAVVFANRALTYAPNHSERAEVLTMLAHANEQMEETK